MQLLARELHRQRLREIDDGVRIIVDEDVEQSLKRDTWSWNLVVQTG